MKAMAAATMTGEIFVFIRWIYQNYFLCIHSLIMRRKLVIFLKRQKDKKNKDGKSKDGKSKDYLYY